MAHGVYDARRSYVAVCWCEYRRLCGGVQGWKQNGKSRIRQSVRRTGRIVQLHPHGHGRRSVLAVYHACSCRTLTLYCLPDETINSYTV